MEIADHIALARTYIAASVRLEEMGIHQLAAEAVWGAANLSIEAVRHTRGQRHGNPREKAGLIRNLTAADGRLRSFSDGFGVVKDELHNHFYTNRLSATEAELLLVIGRDFVEQMLAIAESPRRRTGAS